MTSHTLFSAHPKNVATEALNYTVNQYPSAWLALRGYLERIGATLPKYLNLQAQFVFEDGAQPNLVKMSNFAGIRSRARCLLFLRGSES